MVSAIIQDIDQINALIRKFQTYHYSDSCMARVDLQVYITYTSSLWQQTSVLVHSCLTKLFVKNGRFDLLVELIWFIVFNATFSNISAIPWRPVLVVEEAGVSREPPTMGKQLVNFIICGCESSAPFL